MAITFRTVEEFKSSAGTDLGVGEWFTITQALINDFADTTEDHQWIHTDTDRAASSAIGSTVAHGYLTLSLIPRLSADLFDFDPDGRAINYGLDKVRFPTFVRPGDRIRARGHVEWTRAISDGGVLGCVRYTIEIEGTSTPACVAQALMVAFPA